MSRRPFARLAWLVVAFALHWAAERLHVLFGRCVRAAEWAYARVPE